MTLLYDPPTGWRYGFPRAYAPLEGESLVETLVRDGYPRTMAEDFGAKHCRFIGSSAELESVEKQPSPNRHWDSIARKYVEHDTLPQETFGPLDDMILTKDCVAVVAEDPDGAMLRATRESQGISSDVYIPPDSAWQPLDEEDPVLAAQMGLGIYGAYTPTRVGAGTAANDNRKDRGDYISTYTGRFYPMSPRASEVRIEDIAHSLAMQCRYAGHGKRFYSVAEHSVHIARHVSAPNQLAALLHDAPEAYLVDVPRPVKRALVGYKEAEQRVWMAVSAAFGLSPILPDEVHEADSRIICDEMDANMHETDPNYTNPLGVELQFWDPAKAELYFLDTFRRITRGEDLRRAA